MGSKGLLNSNSNLNGQKFERVYTCKIVSEVDKRFSVFVTKIWPHIELFGHMGHLIFFRTYFDLIRIKNFLKELNASFVCINEYSCRGDISSNMALFSGEKKKILLYTERAHFFNRYSINGIMAILFYSIPFHITYYAEMLSLLNEKAS